ncbi:basic salivary proline-rich protein 1-like [Nyctibius grandis]|uniref:basic salivary proline-rich protein 1-like n=1 Tax=Nyctibius grandis TaxID=48427 RepID=UPI0035BBD147
MVNQAWKKHPRLPSSPAVNSPPAFINVLDHGGPAPGRRAALPLLPRLLPPRQALLAPLPAGFPPRALLSLTARPPGALCRAPVRTANRGPRRPPPRRQRHRYVSGGRAGGRVSPRCASAGKCRAPPGEAASRLPGPAPPGPARGRPSPGRDRLPGVAARPGKRRLLSGSLPVAVGRCQPLCLLPITWPGRAGPWPLCPPQPRGAQRLPAGPGCELALRGDTPRGARGRCPARRPATMCIPNAQGSYTAHPQSAYNSSFLTRCQHPSPITDS